MDIGEEGFEQRISRLRARSEELRCLSEQMKYSATQASMLGLAQSFDNFADWLEGRQDVTSVDTSWS
jgi:hypothetical protein